MPHYLFTPSLSPPSISPSLFTYPSLTLPTSLSQLAPPPDPIFILHHTNVDRLWWTWQRMAPAEHLLDYAGPAAGGSAIEASLDDRLEMGGLAPAVRVRDIMSTGTELLCYGHKFLIASEGKGGEKEWI